MTPSEPDVTPTAPIEPVAVLRPSAARRVFGVSVLGALAFLLIYVGLRHPAGNLGWTVFLLGLGFGALWLGWRLWNSTATGLILTQETLHTTDGEVLAEVADIIEINRGAMAIKPAGGFTLVTRSRGARAWHPGLWWRAGRRIGVGGVTNRHEARFMGEMIAMQIAERQGVR